MPGTKIINVLRDDKLEDILHIFRTTSADEVILVLPKRAKAFNDEVAFATLADESHELGKGVLILSENPELNQIAASYDLGVLTSEKTEPKESVNYKEDEEETGDEQVENELENIKTEEPITETSAYNEDEDETEEEIKDEVELDDTEEEQAEKEHGFAPVEYSEESRSFSAQTTLAAAPKAPKTMNDIIGPDSDKSISIKINKKDEQPINVQVKKETPDIVQSLKDNGRASLDEIQNVWQKRDYPKKIYAGPAPGFKLPGFPVGRWVSNVSKKSIYLYGFGVVIIFGFVLYISMGKAEIIIKPRTHSLEFSINVMASDEFLSVDSELRRIPGQLFIVEKKIEETFQASGEKDVVQKARGMLTVYNEYGTTPQVLIATTRFESSDGLVFRSLKTITVPGTKVVNGEIIPGSIDVEIIADKAGEAYNVEPGKFTIPAFKEKGDSDRYQKFYARSESSMKGGIIGKAKVVTEEDYINAKKKIEEKIITETENELKKQATGLKILGFSTPVIKEITPSAQIDEAINEFTVSGIAELNTVGFKEDDLYGLIVSYVESINSDIIAFPEKLDISFGNINFNVDNKNLSFSLSIKGQAYSKVNEDKIVTDLMGKGEGYITDYIKEIEGISSARVILSPFWVWKVPVQREKIHVMFDYN